MGGQGFNVTGVNTRNESGGFARVRVCDPGSYFCSCSFVFLLN